MSQFIGQDYKHLCNSISKFHDPKLHAGVVCLKKLPRSNKGFLKIFHLKIVLHRNLKRLKITNSNNPVNKRYLAVSCFGSIPMWTQGRPRVVGSLRTDFKTRWEQGHKVLPTIQLPYCLPDGVEIGLI